MVYYAKIILALIALLINVSYASGNELCKEKVLDMFTVEGVYLGIECGDFCYASLKLDDGKEYSFACGEDDANKNFGKIGNRVCVNIKVQQFWNEYANDCSRLDCFS